MVKKHLLHKNTKMEFKIKVTVIQNFTLASDHETKIVKYV